MDELTFRPIDETAARAVIGWRYEPPYDRYNLEGEVPEAAVAFLLDPVNRYYRMDDTSGELAAFCCFGHDARVVGGDYRAEALDIGMGVRPDLTGRGLGAHFAVQVAAFAKRTFAPAALRVTIAEFNRRAQRVWQTIGFRQNQTFRQPHTNDAYVVLVRPVESHDVQG
jgi:GNAT superfamily N-acetyltransferase